MRPGEEGKIIEQALGGRKTITTRKGTKSEGDKLERMGREGEG